GSGPVGCSAAFRARSAIILAAGLSSAMRLKIHGPSDNGGIDSICLISVASLSVLGLTPRNSAAFVRLSQGSTPSAVGRYTGIPMMGSQRSDALARPTIAMAGRQLIPIENARDQIIVRNEHQLSYGLDDVRRGGVALAVAPPGQSQFGVDTPH